MTVCIVGLGLMGGSFAIDLRESGFASSLIGVEASHTHAEKALALGLVDKILPLEAAITQSQLVFLATPVDHLLQLVPRVLDLIRPDQVVFDAGSTKHPVVQSIKNHPLRKQFVATHPMAGTEYSGPGAALSGLFQGKCVVLCDTEQNSEHVLEVLDAFIANTIQFRNMLENKDLQGLYALMEQANAIKRILN